MNRLLIDLPYFIEIARHKSFTRAAEILHVPVSTLSRRITILERELGIQLLNRSTRNMELTDAGRQLYEQGNSLLGALENLKESLHTEQRAPKGKIRISMAADAYYLFFQGAFCSFTRRYPEIEMHVIFTERWKDPTAELVDLSIRGGSLPDSELIQRKLVTVFPALYASPKLLEIYPVPETPADLAQLPFILHVTEANYTVILQKEGFIEKVVIKPVHVVNSSGPAMEFMLDGQAASLSIPSLAQKYVEQGLLVQLLPEWKALEIDMSVVMAPGNVPNRIRLFVDHLVEYLKG